MSFSVIYSREFLTKVFSWPQQLKSMAFQAAEHAAQDPNLHDYFRAYITPYRQKHPTTDHQYTLYFLIVSNSEIFVTWINDSSCLHTTRANFPDPCNKEFQRLKSKGLLEAYNPNDHKVQFEVNPSSQKPLMCRSRFLGENVLLNSYFQDQSIVGYAFSCSETIEGIAEIHVANFLDLLHEELTRNHSSKEFQIEFTKLGHAREMNLLSKSSDKSKWQVVDDKEDFILKKI